MSLHDDVADNLAELTSEYGESAAKVAMIAFTNGLETCTQAIKDGISVGTFEGLSGEHAAATIIINLERTTSVLREHLP